MTLPRLHWDSNIGWLLDVDCALTDGQIQRVAQWALPKQIDRYRGLPLGAKKDELGKAIELLKQGKITQVLIGEEATPFQSTQRMSTRSYF